MAKKPKPAPEDDDAPQEQAKGGGRKKLVLAAAGVAILAAGGGGWFAFAGRSAPAVEKAKPASFVDLREMMVNLASEPNQERPRLLKFKVALEVKDAKAASEIQPLLPRVEDSFQIYMRELRASELDGSAGVYRLREELLRRVNVAVHPAKVDAILFKDLIVQ
jgi:flagellar protein FliL